MRDACNFALLALLASSNVYGATYTYEVFTLPGSTPSGEGPYSEFITRSRGIRGINDAGEVGGTYYVGSVDQAYAAFVRTPDGVLHTYTPPQYEFIQDVADLDNQGRLVGTAFSCSSSGCVRSQAFATDDTSPPNYFDTPFASISDFSPITVAGGINESGSIVGSYLERPAFGVSLEWHGFVRDPNGDFTQLDVPGEDQSQLWGINDSGQIVGTTGDELNSAFIRDIDGTFTLFSAIIGPGGASPGELSGWTYAYGINNLGQISGSYYDDYMRGYVRDADGTFSYLDIPGGNIDTWVFGINNLGQVAGIYFEPFGVVNAFIATPVSAVPLPGPLALLGMGAVVLSGGCRRRRLSP